MAIPAAVIGALKVALKKAAVEVGKAVAVEAAAGGTAATVKAVAAETLKAVGKKAMTDAQAVILNRLKSAPSKALFDFAAREMGIPVNEIKGIVKFFKQSPKMKELSVGNKFKEVAYSKLKNELGLNTITKNVNGVKRKADTIKDIIRKADEKNAEKKERDYNGEVKELLKLIQQSFIDKVQGISSIQDKHKVAKKYPLDLMKYFKRGKNYTQNNLESLSGVLDSLENDIEYYQEGLENDVRLVEDDTGWKVYSKQALNDFIFDIKEDVQVALQ